MRRLKWFVLASLVTLVAAPAYAATTPPLRHISFSFTMTSTSTMEQQGSGLNNETDHSGGVPYGSAIQRSSTRQNAKGTIDADVLAATQDGGLVVRTSEQGDNHQSPAEVAIKGDGTILTTATTKLTDEQRYVLALLGRQIMPFSEISVGKTWSISEAVANGGSDVTNFRITGVDGTVVHLAVQRVVETKSMGGYQASLTGNIDYDYKRLVPTSGSLQTMLHAHGIEGFQSVQGLLTFSLATDSFGKGG